MLFVIALLVLAGFAVHVMSPEERVRLLRGGLRNALNLKDSAVKYHQRRDPFDDALAARTRWIVVTPAVAILYVVIFLGMLRGDGSLSDPETLVGWGASVGPRTTTGQWWRLVTFTLVNAGFFQLAVNLVVLVQVGSILERMLGHTSVATGYLAAGLVAGLVSLSSDPLAVTAGGAGALFGLYGLLLATALWGFLPRSELTFTLATVKRLAPAAAVFLIFHAATGSLSSDAAMAGLGSGGLIGLILARRVAAATPTRRELAIVIAGTLVVVAGSAIALGGVADVRPEIQRVIAIEDKTARAYQASVQQFRLGAIKAEALAQVIERSIVPELRAARLRLKAISGVPAEHQPLVAATDEYLRLRDESWRLRAEALNSHSMGMLEQADGAERASLDAFARIKE
jgi:membrane associated rhomboid family serine protease